MKMTLLVSVAVAAIFAMVSPSANAQAQSGSIRGVIFLDDNNDGKRQDAEGGGTKEQVQLWKVLEDGTREKVATTQTKEDGSYEFEDLPFGTYVLVFVFSSGLTVESLPHQLTAENPDFVAQNVPVLQPGERVQYMMLTLGLRNPANATGLRVSRFRP